MLENNRLNKAYNYSEIHKIHALWRAVIEEAISDLLNPGKSFETFEAKQQVIEFIQHEDFELICILAGLDADYTKQIFLNIIKTLRTKKYRNYMAANSHNNKKQKNNWKKYSKFNK